MSSTEPRLILAVADDLTGAVEAGRALASRSRVDLGLCAASEQVAASSAPRAATSCTVLDLDCRNLDAETAHRSVAARTAWFLAAQSPQTARDAQELRGPRKESEEGSSLAGAAPRAVAFLKIDSLLRGPVGAVIEAVLGELAGASERVPVICPAVPALGRTVVDGSVVVDGRSLTDVDAWSVERTGAPATVADALHRPAHLVRAADLADPGAAALLLEAAQREHAALVVDASTEADLDVVAAACSTDTRALPVGAVALAAALGRRWDPQLAVPAAPAAVPSSPAAQAGPVQDPPAAGSGRDADAGPSRVLIVVGTMEPSARRQVQHVEQAGQARVVVVQEKLSAVIDAGEALAYGPVVLTTPEPEGPADPAASHVLAGAAAELATRFRTDLIVLGGHTARQVCASLGVHSLDLGPQVATGAVISTTASGRRIITRPGSFGTTRALSDLLDALTHGAPTAPSTAPSTPPALSTPSDRRSQP